MIDYEKLKIAHELAKKLKFDDVYITWHYNIPPRAGWFLLCFKDEDNLSHEYEYYVIDDLITKLQELIAPKRAHKYIVGDEVWFLRVNGAIDHSHVVEIDFDSNDMYLINGVRWFEEKDLYPTKQALIEAQITYWQSLLEPEKQIKPRTFKGQSSPITECDHDYKEKIDKSGRYFVNMCHKCGHHYPIALLKPESRHIQEAPFLGNLSREEIKRAVESVSKPAPIPYDRCPHGVICYETENVRMYCEICGNKPAKEECQHESNNIKYIMNPGSEGLEFPASRCKKCGEFYK